MRKEVRIGIVVIAGFCWLVACVLPAIRDAASACHSNGGTFLPEGFIPRPATTFEVCDMPLLHEHSFSADGSHPICPAGGNIFVYGDGASHATVVFNCVTSFGDAYSVMPLSPNSTIVRLKGGYLFPYQELPGYSLALSGWLGILVGQFAWYANFTAGLGALLFLLRFDRAAIALGLLSGVFVTLGTGVLLFTTQAVESGLSNFRELALDIGYYVWALSIGITALAPWLAWILGFKARGS